MRRKEMSVNPLLTTTPKEDFSERLLDGSIGKIVKEPVNQLGGNTDLTVDNLDMEALLRRSKEAILSAKKISGKLEGKSERGRGQVLLSVKEEKDKYKKDKLEDFLSGFDTWLQKRTELQNFILEINLGLDKLKAQPQPTPEIGVLVRGLENGRERLEQQLKALDKESEEFQELAVQVYTPQKIEEFLQLAADGSVQARAEILQLCSALKFWRKMGKAEKTRGIYESLLEKSRRIQIVKEREGGLTENTHVGSIYSGLKMFNYHVNELYKIILDLAPRTSVSRHFVALYQKLEQNSEKARDEKTKTVDSRKLKALAEEFKIELQKLFEWLNQEMEGIKARKEWLQVRRNEFETQALRLKGFSGLGNWFSGNSQQIKIDLNSRVQVVNTDPSVIVPSEKWIGKDVDFKKGNFDNQLSLVLSGFNGANKALDLYDARLRGQREGLAYVESNIEEVLNVSKGRGKIVDTISFAATVQTDLSETV